MNLNLLLAILIWIVNFCISWYNAYVCGKDWVETKSMGGWPRFMNWMGTIMSATGFSWCYLLVLMLGGYHAQSYFLKSGQAPILTERAVLAGINLGYVILVPGFLFSGTMIWLDSVVRAWRDRDLSSVGTAAWNSYAELHNTFSAYSGISGAVDSVMDFFKKSDDDDDLKGTAILIVVLLVAFALIGGVLTTWGIISHYAATEPLPKRTPEYAPA